MQTRALREYATRRGWTIALQVKEIGSGASQRERREQLLEAARRREIDVVLVWRLDRWGRSVTDLLATLQELEHLGVGFVSLTEALDLTTPAGRAMAGLAGRFRRLCGGRDYAKPQRRSGGAACMSVMWDSALSRSEQRSNQRIGCLESAATQAKRQYGLYDLQLLRWIYPQVDLGCAGISVAEPQCHLANVPCGPEYGEGAAMPELMGRHGASTQR